MHPMAFNKSTLDPRLPSIVGKQKEPRSFGFVALSSVLLMPGSSYVQNFLFQPRDMHNLDPRLF